MNLYTQLAISACVLILLFTLCSVVSERIKNYGIVDVVWSYSFSLVALICFFLSPGFFERKVLISLIAVVWSIRLGTYLFIRVSHHHPKEDSRYAQLRTDWSENLKLKMAAFFQLQALTVIVLSLPFYLISSNKTTHIELIEILGFSLWIIAIAGETLADIQLAKFKKNPLNSSEVCSEGLWRYSRHPNYFFEWLIWVSYFIIACGSPYGWLSIISPISILYLLLKKTGVPMVEEQALRKRREKYTAYQNSTSMFIPWFPKK
jgi:steroid 5-alpha reductase family enzyme